MSQTNPQANQQANQNLITIKINNQTLQCNEGDTVLEVARANGIFIPTICYLSGCSPTLACKMCMGENSEGKRVYTCNTKAKDGLEIFTDTPSLRKERQMIMQTYDVNHPLECGVCDKSGECELQNLTLYTQVSRQDFALPDDEKHSKFWAQAEYDPNLCIVCERCATTCKDNIGEAKLKANKADLHSPDDYKDKMEKDPYSVWSKKQKSLIEFVGETPCVDCGECIAVCPVGALTYKDFSYTANAWELKSIPSTCTHCAAGCQIIYEKRHFTMAGSATNGEKIYRVKNDFHFAPICGAGRFGFGLRSSGDLQAKSSDDKDRVLNSALNALKTAKSINLGSQATNEEALIAQNLATHFGLKIYNNQAYAYQRLFGKLPLNHTLGELKESSVIIALGASVRLHNPHIQYALNNAIRIQKGVKLFYVNPIFDSLISSFSRSVESISYGADCEGEALLSVLLALQEACGGDLGARFGAKINDEAKSMLSHITSTQEKITQTNTQENAQNAQESSVEKSTESKQESKQDSSQDSSQDFSNVGAQISVESSTKIVYKALQEAKINLEDFGKIATALLATLPNTIESAKTTDDTQNDAQNSAQNKAQNDAQDFSQNPTSRFANASLVVGAEVLNAILRESHSANIVKTLGILENLGLKVFVLPNGANVAGIARICTLEKPIFATDKDAQKASIGIRDKGECVWDSYFCDCEGQAMQSSKPSLILPACSQINATMTNYENKVLPINRVLDYAGFDLGDIAKYVASIDKDFALSYAVCVDFGDYALELPKDKGFQALTHSALKNHYSQNGEDKRGYALKSALDLEKSTLENKSELASEPTKSSQKSSAKAREFNAYLSYPQNLFDTQTALDKNMQQKDGFYTSKAHFDELGLSEGQEICLELKNEKQDFGKLQGRAFIDYGLSQNIWLISPHIFANAQAVALPSNYLSAKMIK